MSLPEEFDIIVCGGGASGCVVAGRLANLDHNLTVLLIEAGASNLNDPMVVRPAMYPHHLKLDSKTVSFYESRPSEWLAGRKAVVSCAHVLGGGSSINWMTYTRGSASDYDGFQSKGWTTQELLPLMRKCETYQRASNRRGLHGFDGPVKASFGGLQAQPIIDDFLRATESQGIPTVDDLQDLSTAHGAEPLLHWIDGDTGRRSDAAHAYIHATRAVHSNLYLACNTKVDQVIIEDGRAVAVQTVPTKPLHRDQPKIFKARMQIVVSGGALSSPLVLQRSGIGDHSKLKAAGIEPMVHLPGVGLKFQDHHLTYSVFWAKPDTETFDDLLRGDPETRKRALDEWNLRGTGPLASNGIEACAKVRPSAAELKEMETWPTPDFKSGWDSYFAQKPDKPVVQYAVMARGLGDHTLLPSGKFFTIFNFLEYPFSRGSTHVVSADPYASPDFQTGFLSDERDIAPMVWGYIKARETARRMDAYAGEVETMHPSFDYDSPARCRMDLKTIKAYALPGSLTAGAGHGSRSLPLEKPESLPAPGILSSSRKEVREELKYSSRDIKAIEDWVRRSMESTWHCLGTCSMAPKEGNSIVKHGVVDERLNVHGVKRLKVADLSICPDNVGCNTYSTALLIGEKAALLVAEDLGFAGDSLEMRVPTWHAPGEMAFAHRV